MIFMLHFVIFCFRPNPEVMIRSRIALFGGIAFVSVLCGYLYTSSTSISIGYVPLGQVESNRSLDRFRGKKKLRVTNPTAAAVSLS